MKRSRAKADPEAGNVGPPPQSRGRFPPDRQPDGDLHVPSSVIDSVVSLCKRRGFVFPCGEIYGGTKSAWDYGPLGVELKENIKRQWWRSMVTSRDDVVGLDSSVILPTKTWEASGHLAAFTDPLTECLHCHKRFRADHLQEELAAKKGIEDPDSISLDDIACPNCGTRGEWTEPRPFNGMLKTYLGVVEDESGLHYLRPETAQGIFLNFVNVMNSARKKPPFGIAQLGKAFRNEITPGNFIFRTREFEHDGDGVLRRARHRRGVAPDLDRPAHAVVRRPRHRPRQPPPLRAPCREAVALLQAHRRHRVPVRVRRARSGASSRASPTGATTTSSSTRSSPGRTCRTSTRRPASAGSRTSSSRRPVPTRSLMAFLIDAYAEDEAPNAKGGIDKRTVLRLDPRLAPVKVAVLPLSRNPDLSPKARSLADRAAQGLERRLRRCGGDRSSVPPSGRDRHAVLRHRRLREPRRRRGDDARARHDEAGADRTRTSVSAYLAERLLGC